MGRTMRGRHCGAPSRRPARTRSHRSAAPSLNAAQQVVAGVLTCLLATAVGAAATLTAGRLSGTEDLARSLTRAAARTVTGGTSPGTDATRRTVDGEVLGLLEAHYYKPLDEAALRGLRLDRLPAALGDTYTHYLMPESAAAAELSDTGRYSGVGVDLATSAPRSGATATTAVTSVVPGSPAARAEVRTGDVVIAVDDVAMTGLPLADVLSALRGDAGTRVTLTLARDGRRSDVPMTRELIRQVVVSRRILTLGTGGSTVGVVRVAEFDEGTGRQVRAAVQALRRSGVRGYVVDLRGNPGGLVDEAVSVVSAFVPRGTVAVRQQGLHVPATATRTTADPVAGGLPVAVLVDGQTASSGEIVAGALRDDASAVLVGTTTFGKGVVQRTWPIEDGSLKVTVAEWTTPRGTHLDKVGLRPDVLLPTGASSDAALVRVLRDAVPSLSS